MTKKSFFELLKKGSPVIPLLLSLLCAVSLWLYVMSVESPVYTNTFYGVKVELRNESVLQKNSLSVFSGQNSSVNVTVTGKRSLINSLRSEDLTAYVDVGNITDAGEYGLDIKLESMEGLTLTSLSVNKVTVYIESMITKYVSIDPEIVYYGGVSTPGCSMGSPYIMPTSTMPEVTTVAVTGPSSLVSNIEKAQVNPIDLGTIESSMQYDTYLQLVDASGQVYTSPYITIANSRVTVYFPVMSEKEVEVVPEFTGTFDTKAYSYSVTPAKVKVRGEVSVLKATDRISFTVEGKDADLVGSKKYALVMENEALKIADGTEQVTLTVKKNDAKADSTGVEESEK